MLRTRLVLAAGLLVWMAPSAAPAPDRPLCPVRKVPVAEPAPRIYVNGRPIGFCCRQCARAFSSEPERYLDARMGLSCPVLKKPARVDSRLRVKVNNELFYFCCGACLGPFKRDPSKFITRLTDPVSGSPFKPATASPCSDGPYGVMLFESAEDKAAFDREPEKYVR